MFKGWFVGDFTPTLYPSQDVEVALKRYVIGDYEALHHHKIATEITVIVSGSVMMNGHKYNADDVIIMEPGESTDFKCLTDVVTVCVKLPCVKNDKYVD